MNTTLLLPNHWQDYELIDSGDEEKLERFGKYIFIRPEPKAIWKKTLSQQEWSKAIGVYRRNSSGGGQWNFKAPINDFGINWKNLRFMLKPTGFKHVGLFPEQAAFWEWIQEKITAVQRPTHILNLFAYTGGSTVAAMAAGAKVTHVDSAKDIITWANENIKASGLEGKPVRWIIDDVIKYVKREIKRGVKYDGIIMDPPKFGRGSDGQVWKIEQDLPILMDLCKEVLVDKPLFFIINAYTTDYSALTLQNILSQTMKKYGGEVKAGELVLKHSANDFLLSTGIFARWSQKD